MTALELSPANGRSVPSDPAPETSTSPGQYQADAQAALAGAASQLRLVPDQRPPVDTHAALAWDQPELVSLAVSLDALEGARIAAENRFRQLIRNEPDSDGKQRGFGLNPNDPVFHAHQALVAGLVSLEKDLSKALSVALRSHPLHPWIKGTIGVGEKQAARLLAAIGDPYWNTLRDRPRTVSGLWKYCGLHVLPVDHRDSDIHGTSVGGQSNTLTGHLAADTQEDTASESASGGDSSQIANGTQAAPAGVAPRRQRGQKAKWSTDAKMRAHLIAEKCTTFDGKPDKNGNPRPLSPYRAVYDDRKQHTLTQGRTHVEPCRRCGPKGNPAEIGSPWSQAHHHADALRVTSKEILKDLWRAARAAHGVAD